MKSIFYLFVVILLSSCSEKIALKKATKNDIQIFHLSHNIICIDKNIASFPICENIVNTNETESYSCFYASELMNKCLLDSIIDSKNEYFNLTYNILKSMNGASIASILSNRFYKHAINQKTFELLLEKSKDGECYDQYNQWSGSQILMGLGSRIDSIDGDIKRQYYIGDYLKKYNIRIDTIDKCQPPDDGFNISYSILRHAWMKNRITLK